jgi:hypothetical protein
MNKLGEQANDPMEIKKNGNGEVRFYKNRYCIMPFLPTCRC